VVQVEGLRVVYDSAPVLDGVSLEVSSGEFVAVMGDNGSGKTTLLLSLLGLIQPSAGRVTVLGQDTHQARTSELARRVGFVFQNPDHQLFAESVWDEAVFAPRNFDTLDQEAERRIGYLMARCGLNDRRGDHPYQLSYGEKRRLNLVSVLSYSPRILLLDEMLIGQDMAHATFLLDLLQEEVKGGSTAIMVNHNPEVTARYASRLVFMERGRILVDAPTEPALRELASLGKHAYLPSSTAYVQDSRC
jgi:energy-coupling factor transport system ATP-binding protein